MKRDGSIKWGAQRADVRYIRGDGSHGDRAKYQDRQDVIQNKSGPHGDLKVTRLAEIFADPALVDK